MEEKNVIVPPIQFEEEKLSFNMLDRVFAFITLVIGFCFIRFVIWNVTGIFTTMFFLVLALLCMFYMNKNKYKLFKNHIIQFSLIIIFSTVFTITANGFIKFLNIIFILFLGAYWVYSVGKVNKRIERFFFFDMLKAIFIMPFTSFNKAPKAIGYSTSKSKLSNTIKLVLFGLVITIPITSIVALLLVSADSGVEKMLNALCNNFFQDAFVVAVQFTFGVPVAFYIFGMLYSNTKKEINKNVLTDDICERKLEKVKIFPNIVMYSAVTPICILYILFFISQLQYFLSAFNGILPNGYSYANYARRGFFELTAIAIINLMILLTINFLSKQTGENKPMLLKAYSILISVFTILIITTALSKMIMYITKYGLTQLRVYTSWFMILLAIVFILIIIKQLNFNFNFVRYAVITFVIMFGILCFSNVDGNIAKYNIEMYRSGQLKELDVNTLCELSDDSLIYVLKSDVPIHNYATKTLNRYHIDPYNTYNISSFQVKRMLDGR